MKMNYFSFLRIATKHIICEKCLNITQVLFEIGNSGLPIFSVDLQLCKLGSHRRTSCNRGRRIL